MVGKGILWQRENLYQSSIASFYWFSNYGDLIAGSKLSFSLLVKRT